VEDEVRADLRRQSDLARESHLLVEAELLAQQPSDDPLHIPTLGTMNMDDVDVRRCACEMGSKTLGEGVDTSKFLLLGFRQGATRESLVADEHRRAASQLGAEVANGTLLPGMR
jgi:hypothetical protein